LQVSGLLGFKENGGAYAGVSGVGLHPRRAFADQFLESRSHS